MKRAKLIDRVKLLADKRGALMIAAKANVVDNEWDKRRAETRIEEAAIEYAIVAIRYLGGDKP